VPSLRSEASTDSLFPGKLGKIVIAKAPRLHRIRLRAIVQMNFMMQELARAQTDDLFQRSSQSPAARRAERIVIAG
jgi:hypothetical protein